MSNEDIDKSKVGEEKSMSEYDGEAYYLKGINNKYLHRMDLGVFMQPKYALCNTCPFAPKNGGECDDFIKGADCIIERTFFDVLMQTMAEQGVTDEDRLLVFPMAQKLLRLNRLYALELNVDLRSLYDVDMETGKNHTLDIYKEIIRMIDGTEKGYIQILKELLSTRKERNMKKRGNKDSKSLSDILANLS